MRSSAFMGVARRGARTRYGARRRLGIATFGVTLGWLIGVLCAGCGGDDTPPRDGGGADASRDGDGSTGTRDAAVDGAVDPCEGVTCGGAVRGGG